MPWYQPSQCGLGGKNAFTFDGVVDPTRGQVELSPIDAMQFRHRWVPGVVWVGKTDPAEPVVGVVLRVQPRHGAIGNPVGVVPLSWYRIVLHLGCPGVASTRFVDLQLGVEDRIEHPHRFGVIFPQPLRVVQRTHSIVGGKFHVFEPAVRFTTTVGRLAVHGFLSEACEGIFCEECKRVEKRLEVRLADECGAPAVAPQVHCNARCVDG